MSMSGKAGLVRVGNPDQLQIIGNVSTAIFAIAGPLSLEKKS
jgi:hypothetical protein